MQVTATDAQKQNDRKQNRGSADNQQLTTASHSGNPASFSTNQHAAEGRGDCDSVWETLILSVMLSFLLPSTLPPDKCSKE